MAEKRSLGPGRKPMIMPHYPHMLREDSDVWTDFLREGKYAVKEVWYDIHVGEGIKTRDGAAAIERAVAQGVTRKRIDVVCEVLGVIWIVEIKPHANMKALGQVLTYKMLFDKEFQVRGKTVPVVLCDTYDTDISESYEQFGVKIINNS